jgi:hypothetical protein
MVQRRAVSGLILSCGIVLGASGPLPAALVGNWDFGTGALTAVEALPGTLLQYLPDTPIYSLAGGTADPPPLAFATADAFGIASLGPAESLVMRMPDMRGRGSATGLMASFPLMTNGQLDGGAATKLNRYTLVMDVLLPSISYEGPPTYLALFQPRGNADAALFVRKPTRQYGAAIAYGGSVPPDTWHRLAMVMALDRSTSVARYETFIDGAKVGEIVWDQIVVDSTRNEELKTRDLVPDGAWSIAALADTLGLLPADRSGFFAFNDNSGELGVAYVANLQFRADALSSAEIAALGGPAAGPIPVPEPAAGLTALFGMAVVAAARRRVNVGRGSRTR